MRYALAALIALGCSPAAVDPPRPADAGDVPDVAPAVDVGSDTGADGGSDAGDGAEGSRCVDQRRGVGMVCAGACDFLSCGTCGNVCPRFYSCCQGSPDRCCITP